MRNDLDGQRWLGYELHDGLLQWIVGARMQLETAIRHEPNSPQLPQLKRALKYVELAIEEGRSLIGFVDTGAHDAPADFRGLLERFVQSVSSLATQQSQTVELQFDTADWPTIPQPVVWNVFRIIEQAVRNAIKHAGPGKIQIRAEQIHPGKLRLIVQDEGVGIHDRNPQPIVGHFGLVSMRHRASLIGGILRIEPGPERGTIVSLEFSPESQSMDRLGT